MNALRSALALCAILAFASTLQRGAQRAEPQSTESSWSPVIQGVRGRLFVVSEGDLRQPQGRVEIELQNVTNALTPIPIWWGNWNDMLKFGLEEGSGAPVVSDVSLGGNMQVPPPFWLELLPRSTTRATVTATLYQHLPSPERLLIRPTVFQGWILFPGRTWTPYLNATFTPPKSKEERQTQFTGPLRLPRVALPEIAFR